MIRHLFNHNHGKAIFRGIFMLKTEIIYFKLVQFNKKKYIKLKEHERRVIV